MVLEQTILLGLGAGLARAVIGYVNNYRKTKESLDMGKAATGIVGTGASITLGAVIIGAILSAIGLDPVTATELGTLIGAALSDKATGSTKVIVEQAKIQADKMLTKKEE